MKALIFMFILPIANLWADASGPYHIAFAKGAITMDAVFTQGPSESGASTLTLTAYESKSHKPVAGVVDVKFDMQAMQMAVPPFETKSDQPGVFTISGVKLGMGGEWFADVSFAPEGGSLEKQRFSFSF